MFKYWGRLTDDTDGRTPKHGYTISALCKPEGSAELKESSLQSSEKEERMWSRQDCFKKVIITARAMQETGSESKSK